MQGDGKIKCNASGIWQPENLSCTSKYAKFFLCTLLKPYASKFRMTFL